MNFGWAVGLAMGVWISGGISEGHVNPAVCIKKNLIETSSNFQ